MLPPNCPKCGGTGYERRNYAGVQEDYCLTCGKLLSAVSTEQREETSSLDAADQVARICIRCGRRYFTLPHVRTRKYCDDCGIQVNRERSREHERNKRRAAAELKQQSS